MSIEPKRFTGHTLDPEIQTPELEELEEQVQDTVSELPAYQEYLRVKKLDDY